MDCASGVEAVRVGAIATSKTSRAMSSGTRTSWLEFEALGGRAGTGRGGGGGGGAGGGGVRSVRAFGFLDVVFSAVGLALLRGRLRSRVFGGAPASALSFADSRNSAASTASTESAVRAA